jgi:hypothetical protein
MPDLCQEPHFRRCTMRSIFIPTTDQTKENKW